MKLSYIAMGVCSALLATSALASNYEPYVISGKTIYLSGQIPLENGQVMFPGQLGGTVSVEGGISAAEWVVSGLLVQLQTAAGSFSNSWIYAGADGGPH